MAVPHSDEWVDVESRPGHLVVMGGEALQRLTDGRLLAVKHRVGLTGSKERLSLAFFLDPRPTPCCNQWPNLEAQAKAATIKKLAGHKGVKRDLFF